MIRRLGAVVVAVLLNAACATLPHPAVQVAMQLEASRAHYTPPVTNRRVKELAALEERLTKELSVTILDTPADEGTYGQAESQQRVIVLAPNLSPDGRFQVLIHEGAHILQPAAMRAKPVSEVFAELVLYEVLVMLGEPRDYAAYVTGTYLAHYKDGLSSAPFMTVDVKAAARTLLGRESQWQ